MSEINAVTTRGRRSRAEAERLVQEYEQSGLSRRAFCKASGVSLHTLDSYRHRERVRQSTKAEQRLVAVELIDGAAGRSGLRVELSKGRSIVVEAGFDVSHLKRLIAVLES